MVTKGVCPTSNRSYCYSTYVHIHQISSTPVIQNRGNELTDTAPAQPPVEQREQCRPLKLFGHAASICLLPSLLVHHFVELCNLVNMESFPS